MDRSVVSTAAAPAAIGPYNQAIRAGGFVFTAGQVPLIPGTKDLAEGDVSDQTRQALENVKAILEAAGTDLTKVVKTTVFLTDMANFAAMNEVYGRFFTGEPPARSTVAVRQLPLDALVEIDVVALAE
jgi:2-iminobutanoate/2-iminopropanoate deaminase